MSEEDIRRRQEEERRRQEEERRRQEERKKTELTEQLKKGIGSDVRPKR